MRALTCCAYCLCCATFRYGGSSVNVIGGVPTGDLSTIDGFGSAFDKSRLLLPTRLQEQLRVQIAKMNAQNVFAEIRSYKEARFSVGEIKMLTSILCLLGRNRKTLQKGGWPRIKEELGPGLVTEMLEIDLGGMDKGELERRWAACMRATQLDGEGRLHVDTDDILTSAPEPIQALCKWLITTRLVAQVIIREAEETEGESLQAGGHGGADDTDEKEDDESGFVALLQGAGDV